MLNDEDIKICRALALGQIERVKEIIRQVSTETGISIKEITGVKKTEKVTRARQIVMYVAAREGISYSTIGVALNRDRSTVAKGAERETAIREALRQGGLTDDSRRVTLGAGHES